MCTEVYNRMCHYEYEYIYYSKWNFLVLFCDKVSVYISRPEIKGLALGLEFFSKVWTVDKNTGMGRGEQSKETSENEACG